MPQLSSLSATTELDAVNQMLSAAGQSAITDFDAAVSAGYAEVETARNILASLCREICSQRWKFNTEWGLELSPSDTYAWTGTDNTTATLNIFTPPAGLMGFRVSNAPTQQGIRKPDVILRRSKAYTTGGPPAASVIVFYDREKNRDGLDSTVYPYLYIDPWWLLAFEDMPETARKYITAASVREFLKDAVSSGSLYQLAQEREEAAWRAFKADQGEEAKYNLLDNAMFAGAALAGRRSWGGVYDRRASPGPHA